MSRYPSNTNDVIDSRDVIERIEELETERNVLVEAIADAAARQVKVLHESKEIRDEARNNYNSAESELQLWDEDEGDELKALKALAEEGENATSEWRHGETLIREDYWVEYVQELCKDIGDIPKDIPHYIVIDWEKTADNIAVDYSTIDYDGVSYYIRSC